MSEKARDNKLTEDNLDEWIQTQSGHTGGLYPYAFGPAPVTPSDFVEDAETCGGGDDEQDTYKYSGYIVNGEIILPDFSNIIHVEDIDTESLTLKEKLMLMFIRDKQGDEIFTHWLTGKGETLYISPNDIHWSDYMNTVFGSYFDSITLSEAEGLGVGETMVYESELINASFTANGYNSAIETIRSHIERSLKNLGVDYIDLLQLHCPPTPVYENEELFYGLSQLKKEGLIAHFGVSVETVDEALTALKHEELATIQLIYNMFRLKPEDDLLSEAKKKNVGIITRVPLASGMLTGKMKKDTFFAKDDHRSFNRNGEAFDKGETFSGVDYMLGLEAVEELKKIKPENMTMAQFALRWILMNESVSCVIPGGKTKEQVGQNADTSQFNELPKETMEKVRGIYDKYIRASVHSNW